jgi:ATP-dependent RNA helicase DeaD
LFVNLGEKDGIRAQEIITAITMEAGIPGSQVGRVEVRDTHAIVEVASAVAELVVDKITGAVVRGRKVQARLDAPKEDRPPRSGPPRSGSDHPARPFERDRGERPARPFDKTDRPARPGAPRSGPPRGGSSDRPARPFNRDAGPRKFDGGNARPTRPLPPRDDT